MQASSWWGRAGSIPDRDCHAPRGRVRGCARESSAAVTAVIVTEPYTCVLTVPSPSVGSPGVLLHCHVSIVSGSCCLRARLVGEETEAQTEEPMQPAQWFLSLLPVTANSPRDPSPPTPVWALRRSSCAVEQWLEETVQAASISISPPELLASTRSRIPEEWKRAGRLSLASGCIC